MKDLKMKPMIFNDVYGFAAILKNIKIEISEEDQKALENQGMLAGLRIVKDSVADIKDAEKEINTFLGGKFGLTEKEMANLNMRESAQVIREIAKFKKSGDLVDFIDAVSQLMS